MTQPRSTDYHRRHRHTFVLRLWAEPDGDALVWRYRLESATGAESRTFASLEALTRFLQEREWERKG